MRHPERARDGQQWLYDYLVKTTGRAVHFEMDGRQMPQQVKNFRMATKYMAKRAGDAERLADAAYAHGDVLNARSFRVSHLVSASNTPKLAGPRLSVFAAMP